MARIEWVDSERVEKRIRAVLEAQTITLSDREIGEELFERLRAFFDDDALVELTAVIAWENSSSKFNRALQVPSQDLWRGSWDYRASGADISREDDAKEMM